jgi:hypothetical protein
MSFDLFIQSFKDGAPVTFSTALIEKGFGPYSTAREPRCWALRYPNGGFGELYVDAAKENVQDYLDRVDIHFAQMNALTTASIDMKALGVCS